MIQRQTKWVAAAMCTISLGSLVFAGDPERPVLPGNPLINRFEGWADSTLSSYAWRIVENAGSGTFFCPGYPATSCTTRPPMLAAIADAANNWNNAALPNGSLVANLTIPTAPTLPAVQAFSPAADIAPDGVSIMTAWVPAAAWGPLGGPAALGVSAVFLAPATPGILTTEIVEADIAINVSSVDPSGVPFWSFTAGDANGTFASWPDPATPRTDPIFGYADLEGVLTHEIGHSMGLGHSLVESSVINGESLMPTMYSIAQAEAFENQPIVVPDSQGSCSSDTWLSFTTSARASLWGQSARTLEHDDLTAIAEPGVAVDVGRIRGTVVYQDANADVPRAGAAVSVVAVSLAQPNAIRIGTLAYLREGQGGVVAEYDLRMLPAGRYHVAAEPLGRNYFVGPPEYVASAGNWTRPSVLTGLTSEFWNTNESLDEFDATSLVSQLATSVSVAAGSTSICDIALEQPPNDLPGNPFGNRLRVGLTGTPVSDIRGILVPSRGDLPANQTLTFTVNQCSPTDIAIVSVDLVRSSNLNVGQVEQLGQVTPTISGFGLPDANGVATIVIPLDPNFFYSNLFAQGTVLRASGALETTNVVSVCVFDR